MPEDHSEAPQGEDVPETEEQAEEPEKFTEEWYTSVETRFKDLGDFIKSGKARHTHAATKPESAAPSAPGSEGEPALGATASGSAGADAASDARDSRPPKPNHIWFRRLGE